VARRGSRSGYRASRLAERRSKRSQFTQNLLLYVVAGVVGFAAVFGAVAVGRALTADHHKTTSESYLALLTFAAEPGGQPSAALLVQDGPGGGVTLYTIPRDLLLNAPNGALVMAGDAMKDGTLESYLGRLIGAPVTYTLPLTYADLQKLGGASHVLVSGTRPFSLQVGGTTRDYPVQVTVPSAQLGQLLGAAGTTGEDESDAAQAIWNGTLKGAALQQADARSTAVAAVADSLASKGVKKGDAHKVLDALLSGRVTVTRIPSAGRVSQGQFAYWPDRAQITAAITRKAPGYQAPYTVIVENGSGAVGVGELVAERLATLDVNLAPVRNADSFDYTQTQILASSDAMVVANQVRGLLKRGVVLQGNGLPKGTIVVIVGKDLKAKELK
jgi:hypothetical protein